MVVCTLRYIFSRSTITPYLLWRVLVFSSSSYTWLAAGAGRVEVKVEAVRAGSAQ